MPTQNDNSEAADFWREWLKQNSYMPKKEKRNDRNKTFEPLPANH